MANSVAGVEKWAKIAEVINEEIEKSSDKVLKKNNHRLWKGYLHKWTNEDWLDILSAVADIQDADQSLFRKDQERALTKAAEIISKEHKTNGRCLDTQEHKHDYWHMVMVLKELYNLLQEPQVPHIYDIE
jgi:hypothetical protein